MAHFGQVLKVCRVNVPSVSKRRPPPIGLPFEKGSCGRADSVIDSYITGPGSKTRWVRYTFYRAYSYHH